MGQGALTVLGVDAATRCAGWAVVRSGRRVASGTWKLGKPSETIPARLVRLRAYAVNALASFRPTLVVVEAAFMAKSVSTTMRLAEARGVVLEAAESHSVPSIQPSPAEWKKAMIGHGNADKAMVADAVRRLLGGYEEPFASDDESDALALALFGASRSREAA